MSSDSEAELRLSVGMMMFGLNVSELLCTGSKS